MERRVVTAFFLDIVGSTALTVRLGPERFKRALDQAFLELKAIIEAESGTIANVIGDAIFALFGTPVAHPDDPHRALRAAQACMRWAETRGEESMPIAVRIGIETGEVIMDLAAAESEAEKTSIGTCVILAARLQQLAEPGHILAGPTCHWITAEFATFVALGDLELKGLGPQAVWRLIALGDRSSRSPSPLIGRASQMAWLEAAYRHARTGRGILAIVLGPPGQGKTRLVNEFIATIGREARILKARCRPTAERSARNPLHELLASGGSDGSAENLADDLVALFPDALERSRVLAALAHSAGLSVSQELMALPAGQRLDEVENGWWRYLAALTRDGPLILWADDAHWAEPETLRLLRRMTLVAALPLLIVVTARPEFSVRADSGTGDNVLILDLDALDGVAALALARHAGVAGLAGIERAEGNPLFIIELARAREIGVTAEVPITLKGIIGARLDELPPSHRELLQCVAVVGEVFTVDDATLLSSRDRAEVAHTLGRLAELAYLQPTAGGFRFHHALLRDVAYDRLATVERLQLHGRYARHGVPAADVETLAHHLWEAAAGEDAAWVWEKNEVLASMRRAALDAHLAASRRYAARFAYERAFEASRRAAFFASDPKEMGQVEQTLAGARAAQGDADEAWAHYLRARACCREAGLEPPADLYPSLLELPGYTSGMFRQLPDAALVEALLQEGVRVARGAGDAASVARLLALRAYASNDAALISEALRISETVVDPVALGSFLEHAAILQNRLGDFAAAQRSYERLDSLGPSGVTTDRQLEFRAIVALNMGRLDEAQDLAARYLAASASRGPHLRTHAYREQSHVLLSRGDWRGLRQLAADTEKLVSEHKETAFCYAVTTAFAFAAVAAEIRGEHEEAHALLARAEVPLQAEVLERESVLLLASSALGRSDKVMELRRMVHQRNGAPLWYFNRAEAAALVMLERWDEVEEVLLRLEPFAARSASSYISALAGAVREEMAAARGGPAAMHRELVELGYRGWSQLLSHRPKRVTASAKLRGRP